MNFEYLIILSSFFFSFLVSATLFAIILLLIFSKSDVEKTSAYECGFHAFDGTRQKFNIRFYIVSIIFIIFDLEVVFLFLWLIAFRSLSILSFFLIAHFIFILTVGFIYEWLKGALVWE